MERAPRIAVIADDHELPRAALSALLKSRLGFERVVETASLDEAFERLGEEEGVALALFDLDMPGVKDAFSLQAVRETHPAMKTAVVSGSIRREDMLAALAAGVHGYVPKTLPLGEMEAALAEIVAGRIFLPASIAELTPARGLAPLGRPPALTERQHDVLRLLIDNQSNKEIARALGLGLGTVKIHLAGLFRALGVGGRSEAVEAAARFGLDRRAAG
ncbi:response regulator [Chenggangzhangella methanolivorans]|uniref:response regulator n=1 Tax=Chenggangzhangella methanolivorans TaxID=1437009 RepID=UPI0021BD674C|nr:response regulator transcription factor [Chenggangzhangella methanolivorans]